MKAVKFLNVFLKKVSCCYWKIPYNVLLGSHILAYFCQAMCSIKHLAVFNFEQFLTVCSFKLCNVLSFEQIWTLQFWTLWSFELNVVLSYFKFKFKMVDFTDILCTTWFDNFCGNPMFTSVWKNEIECHFPTNCSEPPVRMISHKFDINWDSYV